jgi:tetratricopeptide (TPR) repeat protein
VAFLVASLGLITYLNLKYSPSDPRPHLQFREVRERDYFYAFSFVFYTIFVGVGAYAFLRWVGDWFHHLQAAGHKPQAPESGLKLEAWSLRLVSGALVAFGFVPMLLNFPEVTRHGDWIPAEYGYNMLVSCPGEHAVLFTNGDNDTFPLWFMQAVPSRVSNYDPKFGKNVAVANLSLLNTNWYCKQLKRWGAPISFTESQIDKLPEGFIGEDNRTILLKDIVMRDILATSAGVKLNWPSDYGCTPEEFRAKVFTVSYNPRTPVYYATTVSRNNLEDVGSNLRLEGLVNRVVPEQGADQVDVERTRHLLYDVYVMKSMLDPKVPKDENTRGLLINYAASYLALASEYQKADQNLDAQEVIEKALSFDLESDRKVPLFYHASLFAMLNEQYDKSIAYLDSIEVRGYHDPELSLRRGYALEAKGDFAKAESAYGAAMAAAPTQPDPLQALCRLYLDDMHDTSKARVLLQQWLQRAPKDSVASKLLKEIS